MLVSVAVRGWMVRKGTVQPETRKDLDAKHRVFTRKLLCLSLWAGG